jgi:hypothetical protein
MHLIRKVLSSQSRVGELNDPIALALFSITMLGFTIAAVAMGMLIR